MTAPGCHHKTAPKSAHFNVTVAVANHSPRAAMTISFDEFAKIEIRVGTIVAAEPFPEARRPALKLRIDFGSELGLKRSSAQLTRHYDAASLIGRQIAAVVNF